jgi:hypothetical protein
MRAAPQLVEHKSPARIAFDMERDLADVAALASAIQLIAERMVHDGGAEIETIAQVIKQRVAALEQQRFIAAGQKSARFMNREWRLKWTH